MKHIKLDINKIIKLFVDRICKMTKEDLMVSEEETKWLIKANQDSHHKLT